MIRRQLTLPAGPDRVWEALTDPDETERWIGGRIDWEPAEGGPLRFESTSGEVREGVVETVRPSRHLRFRWWPADGSGSGDTTEVTYTLEPAGDDQRTHLTVQEAPVEAAPVEDASAEDAWTALDSLRLEVFASADRGSLCAVG